MVKKQIIEGADIPKAVGPYSQAVKAGDYLFISGQIAIDAKKGELIEGGVEAHTQKILENLNIILEKVGASLDHVVKTTVFLTDLDSFEKMNRVYAKFFNGPQFPARATVEVARLPKEVPVEIEAVAYLKN